MPLVQDTVALLESQVITLTLVGERWVGVSDVECFVGMSYINRNPASGRHGSPSAGWHPVLDRHIQLLLL